MRLLIDTQVLIQAYLGDVFPAKVKAHLENPDNERLVSSMSVVEIALKHAKNKLPMTEAHVHQAVADLRLTVIPFAAQYAYRLFTLPQHHRDPFDRMLIATALVEGIPIVSSDTQFKRYKGLTVLW
ncbi:MAG TPA: type II toxin-antitoxin system VapC family toxin [Bryobacteraceae bacterium]|nr:type II toxin-antitoxin system VapC family toxin [Bryobacteraceae bacterium]